MGGWGRVGGVVLAMAGWCALAPAAQAASPTPAEIVTIVNSWRTPHGIPSVTEDPVRTTGCREHVEYGFANPGWAPFGAHDEDPNAPEYTPEGDEAAHNSVISGGSWADGSAFRAAPYHWVSLYDPRLLRIGAWEESRSPGGTLGCVWSLRTRPGGGEEAPPRPATQRIWTVPGQGTPTAPWYIVARELPRIPAADTVPPLTSDPDGPFLSGPNMLTYWDGPVDATHPALTTVCATTLTGPAGAVATRTAKQGVVVVEKPLVPGAKYTASVTYGTSACSTPTFRHVWSFTTEPRPPAASLASPQVATTGTNACWTIQEPLLGGGGAVITRQNSGAESSDRNLWFGSGCYFLENLSVGSTFTITLRNDEHTVGAVCWSPRRISRTYTRTSTGLSTGPLTDTSDAAGTPCDAAPAITSRTPASGTPGSVVTIDGARLAATNLVSFDGVASKFQVVSPTQLRVTVPATARSGELLVRSYAGSAASTFTVLLPPQNTTPPSIPGDPVVGTLITGLRGSWSGSPTAYAFHWLRCASATSSCTETGITSTGYRPGATDDLKVLRFRVRATNANGTTEAVSAPSSVVRRPIPVNTAAPTVPATMEVGVPVTPGDGTWTNVPSSYTYTWRRCSAAGDACATVATTRSYTPVPVDEGKRLRVVVVAHNSGGASTGKTSALGDPVVYAAPRALTSPTVPATVSVGVQALAQRGTWSGAPTSYAFRWVRCATNGSSCVAISGATAGTYTPVAADRGRTLRVRVTATNPKGSTIAASAPSGVVP